MGIEHHDLDKVLVEQGHQLDRMIEEAAAVIHRQGESVAGSLTETLNGADQIKDQPAQAVAPHDAVMDLAEEHLRMSRELLTSMDDSSEIGEVFQRWSRLHWEMWATLRAIGENRLRLRKSSLVCVFLYS